MSPSLPQFSLEMGIKALVALLVISVIGYAIYCLCQETPRRTWGFVLALIWSTPVLLLLVDVWQQGQFSTAPRYFLPTHVGMLVAIAYFLSPLLSRRQAFRQWIGCALVTMSLLSCLSHWQAPPKYQKSRNLHNPAIASILNQALSPVVILAEPDQTFDIMSLSYCLPAEMAVQIQPMSDLLQQTTQIKSAYILNPSSALIEKVQQIDQMTVRQVYQPMLLSPSEIGLSLWQVEPVAKRPSALR